MTQQRTIIYAIIAITATICMVIIAVAIPFIVLLWDWMFKSHEALEQLQIPG